MPNWTELKLSYEYHQLSVFDPQLPDPYNDWTDDHCRQGFTWRPGSVSFATLGDAGTATIRGAIAGERFVAEGAVRVIAVPYTVVNGIVELGGFETVVVPVPSGTYELLYSAIPSTGDRPEEYHFLFIKNPHPKAEIVIADPELDPPEHLTMEAKSAI